jgi:hypothetical protein
MGYIPGREKKRFNEERRIEFHGNPPTAAGGLLSTQVCPGVGGELKLWPDQQELELLDLHQHAQHLAVIFPLLYTYQTLHRHAKQVKQANHSISFPRCYRSNICPDARACTPCHGHLHFPRSPSFPASGRPRLHLVSLASAFLSPSFISSASTALPAPPARTQGTARFCSTSCM